LGNIVPFAALVGISGSVEIGDFVAIGGQAGFAEHVHVGTRSRIGAQSGVIANLDADAEVVGSPARPAREFFREIATLKKLARTDRS
jgi:UDP-3-O-[3-hydroxymyristoyl] glucosamine N-acyltransferase